MPLMDELALDASLDATAVETAVAAGPLCPEGDHHAVLCGFREINANTGSHGRELTFKIVAGPGKGYEVKEALWSPSNRSAEKDERARNRMRIFAHRLGLLKKVVGADGKTATYQPIPGKADFPDVFGAQCVIRVRHEEREYEKDGKTRKAIDARLDFEGVYLLDDPRVTKCPRGDAQAVAAAATVGPAALGANGKPADTFDDI